VVIAAVTSSISTCSPGRQDIRVRCDADAVCQVRYLLGLAHGVPGSWMGGRWWVSGKGGLGSVVASRCARWS
jgi:hypothetical protein